MKAISVVTLVIMLLTGALAWHQNAENVRLKQQVSSFTNQLTEKDSMFRRQETLLDSLQTENDRDRREIDSLSKRTASEASSTNVPENSQESPAPPLSSNNTADVLARIYNDPRMGEVVRQWSSAKVKEIYGDFAKDHHFSPIQAKEFFDVLTEERLHANDDFFSLLEARGNEADLTETRNESLKKQKGETERRLRILLGETVYTEFEQYRSSEEN